MVVAFSGGVDSSLLLRIAKEVLGERVIAVTARSPTYPEAEIRLAQRITRSLRCPHIVIKTDELEDRNFSANTKKRCFYCKLRLFRGLKKIAAQYGYYVVEGSNMDDLKDFRPGLRALKRLKIESPLIMARLTKQEIRILAKRFRLPNWNRPSMACLASRIPYGVRIDRKILERIEKAERYLGRYVHGALRVRDYYPAARIEVEPGEFKTVVKYRKRIVRYFRKLGYEYVTLDLEGYRTGSLNL